MFIKDFDKDYNNYLEQNKPIVIGISPKVNDNYSQASEHIFVHKSLIKNMVTD